MKENFTPKEKEAIASVLYLLTKADYRTHDNEHQTLGECMSELELDEASFVPLTETQLVPRAYKTMKRMSKAKKRVFAQMITKTARSDGHFGPLEQAFLIELMEMCEIPFVQGN